MSTMGIGAALSILSISMAAAADLLPLQEGNQWTYTMSNGADHHDDLRVRRRRGGPLCDCRDEHGRTNQPGVSCRRCPRAQDLHGPGAGAGIPLRPAGDARQAALPGGRHVDLHGGPVRHVRDHELRVGRQGTDRDARGHVRLYQGPFDGDHHARPTTDGLDHLLCGGNRAGASANAGGWAGVDRHTCLDECQTCAEAAGAGAGAYARTERRREDPLSPVRRDGRCRREVLPAMRRQAPRTDSTDELSQVQHQTPGGRQILSRVRREDRSTCGAPNRIHQ